MLHLDDKLSRLCAYYMQWFFMYLFVCGVYLRIDEYLGIFPSIHFLRGQVVKPRWRYPTQISFISRSNMFRVDSSVVFFCCFLPSPSLSKFQQPAFHNFQGVDPKVNIRQFKGGVRLSTWIQVSPISKLQQTCLETWHGWFHLSQVAAVAGNWWPQVAASDWHQEGKRLFDCQK